MKFIVYKDRIGDSERPDPPCRKRRAGTCHNAPLARRIMTESIIAKILIIPPCRCMLVGKPMLKLRHEADDSAEHF
jgi:hypothetical protein